MLHITLASSAVDDEGDDATADTQPMDNDDDDGAITDEYPTGDNEDEPTRALKRTDSQDSESQDPEQLAREADAKVCIRYTQQTEL